MILVLLYLIYALYMWSIQTHITYISHDLGALEVSWKIQVMGSLQVNDLFTIGS